MYKGNLTLLSLYTLALLASIFIGELNTDNVQFSILPALIGGGAMFAGGIIKGIGKRKAAKKMAKQAKGEMDAAEAKSEELISGLGKFETPEAAKASLALAKQELNSNTLQSALDAQSDQALAGMVGTTGRVATSGADALAAMQKVYGMSQEQKQANAITGEQARQQNVGRVMDAQSELGQYQDIEWQRNIFLPMQQRLELQQGKLGAAGNRYNAALSARYDNSGSFGDALMGAGSFLGSLPADSFKKG